MSERLFTYERLIGPFLSRESSAAFTDLIFVDRALTKFGAVLLVSSAFSSSSFCIARFTLP